MKIFLLIQFAAFRQPILRRFASYFTMPKLPFTYKGLITPVFTPFNSDSARSLNLPIIAQYAQYLAKKQVTGVLVNGTTGEGPSLSTNERKLVAEAWANAVRTTNQHLMIQVGGTNLPDVLELAKHAEGIKADSILCLPELYFKPATQEELKDYLKLVGSAAPNTPLLYYHFPDMTNVTFHMGQCLQSLVGDEIPTFAGIKFTSPKLDEGAQAFRVNNKKYAVFLGNDQLITAATALGMDSFITTTSNLFPEITLEALNEGKLGNVLKSREKQESLSKMMFTISKYGKNTID
ncbi:N-acetylneuraminate lyase-like [Ceratina calcarata]|uniref:N-acetylneuraminate lyase n=1 Tax=Ceratina calcarata TaxID=156304 RepID=A0AAJ7JI09_9HYME|nr:N-acetylneuraminate lyase-like [Ceratina calcarata]